MQLVNMLASVAASQLTSGGVTRLEASMSKTAERLLNLQLFNIHELLRSQAAGGSVDDVVKLYNLIEDQLDGVLNRKAESISP